MSEATGSEASSGDVPWEQHLLLFVEGILAVSSPSLWILCAKCVGYCAQRQCGCPSARKRDYAGHL